MVAQNGHWLVVGWRALDLGGGALRVFVFFAFAVYACKMQALCGEMMILIEGSLVGRDGWKGILGVLRAPVCPHACSSSPFWTFGCFDV